MKYRSLLAATALAFAFAAPGFAATAPKVSPAERCTSLETQWTDAAASHADAKKFSDAKKLADQGTQLCTDKKYSSGAKKITDALNMIGVKPKT
jgi:hypothetical protein